MAFATLGRPAWADCVQTGFTVICSGNSPAGFTNFVDNGLGLTVLPGATVGGNGIGLNNNSSATNQGSISVGNGFTGIAVNNNSSVTNTGSITAGTSGIGIFANTGSTVVNSGTISVGGGASYGIWSIGDNSLINNSGSIRVGPGGDGILASGDSSTIVNSGLISAPTSGFAVLHATGAGLAITNTGTIDGIIAVGGSGRNFLTNSGLITISEPLTNGGGVTHSLDGTFTQTASGTLALRLGFNNVAGNYDTLQVANTVPGTGIANLGGTLRAIVGPGLYGPSKTYSGVLTFAGSTGRFANVETGLVFINASAIYNANSVDLVLSRLPFNQTGAGGANGRAVGNVLEANYSTSLTGSVATFYTQLLQSSAPNTLSQLTGEVATAPQNASFAMMGQFLGTIFGQTGSARALGGAGSSSSQGAQLGTPNTGGTRVEIAGAEACLVEVCDTDATPVRYTAWAQGFGGAGSIDANAGLGSSPLQFNSGGAATGIDARINPNLLLGVTIGTATSGYSLSSLSSNGGATAVVFGLYGGFTQGPAYLDGALAYANGTFNTNRVIGTGSIAEQASASFGGSQYGGRVEGGWRFGLDDRHVLTPFAGLTVQALSQSGYTESSRNLGTGGAGMLGLTVQPQTTTSVRSSIGAQFETAIKATDDAVLRPRLRLGWAHEFNTSRTATATLGTLLPNSAFTVSGAQPAADSLIIGAGFDLELTRMVRMYAQFDGDVASNARAFAGTGGLRLVW